MHEVAKNPTFAVVHVVLMLVCALDGPLLDDAGWMVLSVPPSAVHARPYLQRQLHLHTAQPFNTCVHAEATSRAHHLLVTCRLGSESGHGLPQPSKTAAALVTSDLTEMFLKEVCQGWDVQERAPLRWAGSPGW